MKRRKPIERDPNYQVDGVPPAILGKITQLINAAREEAFAGAQPPEIRQPIEEYLHIARYELERTIKTHLDRKET